MDSNKSETKQEITNNEALANLKKISAIDNYIEQTFEDLVICSANESHVKEIAELWANLACVQQIFAPERYNFVSEGKDWNSFVRKKLSKKNNLLLVMHKKGDIEVRGFLYLQTVTLPSSDLVLKAVIEDVYTKPQYRKQEVATKMLNIAVDWALSQNIKHIDLISLAKTQDPSNFYPKTLKRISKKAEITKNINLELVTF